MKEELYNNNFFESPDSRSRYMIVDKPLAEGEGNRVTANETNTPVPGGTHPMYPASSSTSVTQDNSWRSRANNKPMKKRRLTNNEDFSSLSGLFYTGSTDTRNCSENKK